MSKVRELLKITIALGCVLLPGYLHAAVTCTPRSCNTQEWIDKMCDDVKGSPHVLCIVNDQSGGEMGTEECEQYASCICDDQVKYYFWHGVGCICNGDYYGTGSNCTACPSGGRSDLSNNLTIQDCYKSEEVDDPAAHARVKRTCDYRTATGSYSYCTITAVVSCHPGYYRVNSGDKACQPVGTNYYSYGQTERKMCEPYKNNSGQNMPGETTGSGTGADSITDCKIPNSETWTDGTGTYNYENCYYST